MSALLEEAVVKRTAGPTLLALVCGGVLREAATSLAIRDLGDTRLQARAERMRAELER